jgi:hypothetical protein
MSFIDELVDKIKNPSLGIGEATVSGAVDSIKVVSLRERTWRSKFQVQPVIYRAQNNLPRDVRTFLFDKSCILEQCIIDYKLKGVDDTDTTYKVLMWVIDHLKYTGDDTLHKQIEFWQDPEETIATLKGDCVAEYEEIFVRAGIKSVGNLKVGDEVLSYDFDKKEFVYKPIVKIWDKGVLPIKRVHLRNGQHIDITNDHPLWVRINQSGDSQYKKTYLSDVDLTRWWKRKIPIVVKIPYEVKDIEWLNEDLCVVIGHFLAEGWYSKSHVGSSGYDLIEHIIPLLEKNDIRFTETKNGNGVPCVNFLESDFKEYLKRFKNNSFDIHLPEEIFHLPENKLEKLLYGMWLGDGTTNIGINQYNKEWVYSTSSEQFASDIQRIGLILGRTFHIWKQEHHGGAGKHPIWRITYNPQSHFLKDHGYKDISEVSISYVEDFGEYQTYDFEVEDTHTFVFKNGVVSHQCEDGAILIKSLSLVAGVPDWKIKIMAGNVTGGGHAYCVYIREDEAEVILDWCYWPNRLPIASRPDRATEKNYQAIWFTFDRMHGYAPKPIEYSLGKIN